MIRIKLPFVLLSLLLWAGSATAQIDTLKVMAYSILYLGDTPPCQGPHSAYEGYLENVISYVNPDIVGLEKREAEGAYGSAPAGFADSLLQNSFNAAYPGRFAYCPYTNVAEADNITTLYYNQQKLGYAGILCTYANTTDFTTWKLYYNSPNLATTHDTIFLYVTLNHDQSGTGSSAVAVRGEQIAGEMDQIETHFSVLPNMINMGDFNVHTSTETCYQTLVNPANANYRYYDPPFYPDGTYSYPANWDASPADYTDALSVSTRENSGDPNSCSGNTGGAWSWYDHIFLSASIINKADHLSYLPHSFQVVGNDGTRIGASANTAPNTAVPADVAGDIYQLSEHYPVALSLVVDTSATAAVPLVTAVAASPKVVNPVGNDLMVYFPAALQGKAINMRCLDVLGREQARYETAAAGAEERFPCPLAPGVYYLVFTSGGASVTQAAIQKL